MNYIHFDATNLYKAQLFYYEINATIFGDKQEQGSLSSESYYSFTEGIINSDYIHISSFYHGHSSK